MTIAQHSDKPKRVYHGLKLASFALSSALAMSSGAALADTREWTLDKGHAHIAWNIEHMGLSSTSGRFNSFDGTFMLDEEDFTNSVVTFNINSASIDSNHQGRDNHLRAKEFLNATAYPNISFQSTKVVMLSTRKGKLYGDLSLRGTTAPIVLDFNMLSDTHYPAFLPNYDELRVIGIEATGEVLRLQHGMDFIAFLGSPVGLSISLDLRFDLVDCSEAKPSNIPCNWGYVEGFKGPSE